MLHKTTTRSPVKANWDEQKSKLQTKFPTLSEADLKFEEDKSEEMFKHLENKLSKTREELNSVISVV